MEVRDARLRWVIADTGPGVGALRGDTRRGSQAAVAVVAKVCRAASAPIASSGRTSSGRTSSSRLTMYDCRGRATAIAAAAQ
nr:hypothetical protein [Actinomycetota bacterium]